VLAAGPQGGLAPLVATWLIAATGDSLSPSYYLISRRCSTWSPR